MPIQLEISPKIIGSISTLYNDVNRIFLEFIDNSLDSAEEYYDTENNKYIRPIYITLAIVGNNYRDGKIIIHDNCTGITNLPKVVNSIGFSEKKEQAWTNGQFGYGIYSFMACCSKLEITTKVEDGATYYIPIDKTKFDAEKQRDVTFPDPQHKHALTLRKEEAILFPLNSSKEMVYERSGTKIILSNFDKNQWKDIDLDNLRTEIEKHFELMISRSNLLIRLVVNKNVYNCKPFDYGRYEGGVWADEIKDLTTLRYGMKSIFKLKQPIKVFLKITQGQEINKPPMFISKGRRIAEIKEVKSFKSKNKSSLWDHPNITGFIDLKDFLGPTIARTDFRNTAKSKALFERLIELEPLILEEIRRINKISEESHYRQLESRLNQALSKLAKLDVMNFRKQYISGQEVNLEVGSSGIGLEDGIGPNLGDIPRNRQDNEPNERIGLEPGDIPGDEPGGEHPGEKPSNIESDNLFEDSDFKGKERRRSGFNVKIVDSEPVIDADRDEPMRSQFIPPGEIRIFKLHPNFEERVKSKRSGKQKITERLITYLAGEITVHYKDKFHNRTGQAEYSKYMFIDLVAFIYKFEKMLSDLVGQNLSDLSG